MVFMTNTLWSFSEFFFLNDPNSDWQREFAWYLNKIIQNCPSTLLRPPFSVKENVFLVFRVVEIGSVKYESIPIFFRDMFNN